MPFFLLIFHVVESMNDAQPFFWQFASGKQDPFHFIGVALINGIEHLQDFHVVTRRANERVVIVRHETPTQSECSSRSNVHWCTAPAPPPAVLLWSTEYPDGATPVQSETVLANKVMTIDVQPVTCRNLRESSAILSHAGPDMTPVDASLSSGK